MIQETTTPESVLQGFLLSVQQKRQWDLLEPGGEGVYGAACAVLIEGPVELPMLLDALRAAVERHEILRTSFRRLPGMAYPLQVIGEASEHQPDWLAVEDLDTPAADLLATPVHELLDQFRARVFGGDSENTSLRVCLVPLGSRTLLLLGMSPLCADAATLAILVDELRRSCASEDIPAPAMQYVDVSSWYEEVLETEAAQEDREYWRRQNLGEVIAPRLSFEERAAGGDVFEPRRLHAGIDLEALVKGAHEHGVSLEALLLASWHALLLRFTLQPRIDVGVLSQGRGYEELAAALGPLARYIPVASSLADATRSFELLADTEQAMAQARERQDGFGWDLLDEESSPVRRVSSMAFLFELAHRPPSAPEDGLSWSIEDLYVCSERFKLRLVCCTRGSSLGLELHYDSRLFEERTIRGMLTGLCSMMGHLASSPHLLLSEMELLSPAEREQLVFEIAEKEVELTAAGWCLHQLFEEQAQRTPQQIAVLSEQESLTYEELEERANRLAGVLGRRNVGLESVVGICLDRSVAMVVAILGILKAGAAYLPLDPDHPAERLAGQLEDARAALVVTSRPVSDRLDGRVDSLCLEDVESMESGRPQAAASTPDNLAYVIYTSGSTGRPKGVMISHRAICNRLLWMQRTLPLSVDDRVLQKTPLTFDASIWEIFLPLITGTQLVIARPGGHLDSRYLVYAVGASRITVLQMVPSLLRPFLDEEQAGDCRHLRRLFCGGEALSPGLLRDAFSRLAAEVHNLYGPTEAAIDTTHWACQRSDAERIVPIGRPIENVYVFVASSTLFLALLGAPGELLIGGRGLARGYLGRPGLTAEKFCPDPFSGIPGARLYRTGDLVRRRVGGELEYLGRTDRQVKIRGVRIELREIEALLGEHPQIRQAVVTLRSDEPQDTMVAYVVPREDAVQDPGKDLGPSSLRDFLLRRLPGYMLPAFFVRLRSLPLTPSGKVDLKALPAPDRQTGRQEEGEGEPRTPVEELLAAVWGELLGVGRVGVHDNFFELGGHSLLATRVVARICEVFDIDLPMARLFEAPTVSGLAQAVDAALHSGERASLPPLVPVTRDGDIPLSFAQQRLLFLETLTPGTTLYHIPVATRIQGELAIPVLARSFTELVRRHEILRTTFTSTPQGEVQVIHPPAIVALPVVDLGFLPEPVRWDEAQSLMRREAVRLFDLSRGPLLRVSVLRLDGRDHIVLVTMHHIISDGWSVGVLIRELASHVRIFSEGLAPFLPELPIQYADYAYWQRQWLHSEVLEQQLDFWRQHLGHSPAPLDLPADRPRAAVRSWKGEMLPFRVPRQVAERLHILSREQGTTLFMTLLAALDLLLSRYSGQSRVIVGTPIANRTRVELENLIGFFVNTLAIAADVGAAASFRDLLIQVRKASLGAYSHQDLPFEVLVDGLQLQRDLSRPPLIQVMLALQNAPAGELAVSELRLGDIELSAGSSKFEWTLVMSEARGAILGSIEYASDLFDRTTLLRAVGHWMVLLEEVVADQGRPLRDLGLLTAPERQQLLETGGPVAELESAACLHHLFEQQARRAPGAAAVVLGNETWTYGQLDLRANALAAHLRARGVDSEVKVSVCLERSPAIVMAILAIFKAGGAYVPLDPDYPRTRLELLLQDSGSRVLLTERHLADRLPPFDGTLLFIEGFSEESERPPHSATTPDNMAYVIYTSGSTGTPKGTAVTHRNVARLFAATEETLGFGCSDVWTLFHSYAFDFSVWEIWGALLYGGRLVIVPYLISRSPEEFHELLVKEQVTVLNQTPSAFRQLIHADEVRQGDLSLRLIVFGGEALDLQSLRPWFSRHGEDQPRLVNMYGITETTVHVTYRPLRSADLEKSAGSVIGHPLPDLAIHLLDADSNQVPIGIPGEIHVGGAGLARGYLGRPALTAERFIPDPFGGSPGARLYRSGDLARRLANGDLEYLGRIDSQVKVRGFRIELGEIEAALSGHPEVRDCVVLACRDGEGEVRLAAYFTATGERGPASGDLRAFLQGRLPEHALPAAFVRLDAFPLTAHGKLDRQALPEPDTSRPDLAVAYLAPRTRDEELLAGIWQTALGLERIGIQDNFFALGGDSIRSIRVIALARDAGLQFSLQDLFLHPTIAGLAQALGCSEQSGAVTRTSPFDLVSPEDRRRLPQGLEDAYPLTRLQAGMLYHMELMPESPVYHNIDSFFLLHPFDLSSLQSAVDRAVARHPVLRTAFDLAGYSEPLQLVYGEARLEVGFEDIRYLPAQEQERVVSAYVEQEKARHFDLLRPPQLRLYVHLRRDDAFQFTVTENHAIFDGWSLHSTLNEVFASYSQLIRGKEPPREASPLPFREFVAREREMLASEHARTYWDRQLADCAVAELPCWPAARRLGNRVGILLPQIPHEVSDALRRLAGVVGVPVKAVLLAAHLKVLSLIHGQGDVISGLVVHGRLEEEGGEQTRGLFLNTLPLRLRVESESWTELIRRVFAAEQEMLPFRRYPLAELQTRFGDRPLFNAVFNFTHFHVVSGILQSGQVQVISFEKSEETNFPLVAGFAVSPLSELIGLELAYDASLIPAAQAVAIEGLYVRALETIAARPSTRHDEMPLLSEAERHQILLEWNDTAASYDRERSLHELFAAATRRTPDAVAVTGEWGHLTYGEVQGLSNRIARQLIAQGVGPGTLVGIHLERSLEMVPALLGILKTGGAYVPLAGSWPKARVVWILAALGLRHVVTQTDHLELIRELRHESSALRFAVCVDPAPAGEWTSDGLSVCTREDLDRLSDQALGRRAGSEDLAYIIFTSGSTGNPKGVVVRHRPVVNLIEWLHDRFGFGPADRVLFITALSFDLSVYDIFGLLAAGGSIHVASAADLEEPERLVGLLVEEPITFWDSAPAALQQLVPLFLAADAGRRCALRLVFLSGDWIPLALPDFVRGSFPRARVISLGGATEATVWSNWYPIDGVDERWVSIPYGRPMPNARYHVLDGSLLPVPIGVPGDLYIGGDCLSSYYAGESVLTAERYIPDGVSGLPGERLYRTGDRARHWPDGVLEFLGRLDHQVKIRGFRIELGEIEAVLGQQEGVHGAVVLAREDVPGQKRLVCYYISAADPGPTAEELRTFLQQKLPEYMLPSAFLALSSFPVTPNGKLDRAALPAPDAEGDLRDTFVAPRTILERDLARIWAEVLGRGTVGVHDDFFELGGHSLLAIQLIAKVRDEFRIDLPLRMLFDKSTIGELAAAISEVRSALGPLRTSLAYPVVNPDPDRLYEPFPLTDLQQAYWLGQMSDFELGSMSAHIYQELEPADLEPARFQLAWRRLVERHPTLRMIVLPDGRQQVLAQTTPYVMSVLDLAGLAPDQKEAELRLLRRKMIDQGPGTQEWPLFEVRFSRLDETRYRVHISLSLLVCDAISIDVLRQDLYRLYANPDAALPEIGLAFRDYVVALSEFEKSEAFGNSLAYWTGRLAALPPAPELPLRSDPEPARFVRREGIVEREAWSGLKARARRAGVTSTVAVLTAYARVLASWSKSPHFTLNILFFNRLPIHPDVQQVVGNFSSTILLEIDALGAESFETLAQRIQDRLWQDMEHSHVSGVRVLRELNRLQGVTARPVMPVVFTSDIDLFPEGETADEEQEDGEFFLGALQTPQVWLDHQASERRGRLFLNWEVVEGLFPEGLVQDMFEAYCGLLGRLSDEGYWWDVPPVLAPAVQLELTARVNSTETPLADGLLHGPFLVQVLERPDAVAVISSRMVLTYGELYRLSSGLARRLRQWGARPGGLVAVVMEKGWEQVVAVLAVLQAGAAYLPVDPQAPVERLHYLLRSTQTKLVLTQQRFDLALAWPTEVRRLAVDSQALPSANSAAGSAPAIPVQSATDLAYVIFTSGSTGLPKGVSIDHRGALNTILDVNPRFDVGPEDRVLALSALNFDLSVYDIFGLLAAGGAVVIPEPATLREPAAWARLIEEQRVSVWNSVPALMEMWVDFLAGSSEAAPPWLRLCLLSGDWIPVRLPDRIRSLSARLSVISLGGATEASIWSILYPIGDVDPGWTSIPYGRPMANQRFHVFDPDMNPRPDWVPGELYIGGIGVAQGYWGDEERTRASFIHPPRLDERLYRTGDLGRRRPDGEIEFLGREDLQVKIQGYRIELGEIEAALGQHPGVRACTVAAIGERQGSKRLVGFVVPAGTAGLSPGDLRDFLATKIPSYMLPTTFVFLEDLPLTLNGKIDRGALAGLETAQERTSHERITPRDEVEEHLVRIWEDLLGIGSLGVRDNFFDLGGHSLVAVRLMARIKSELGQGLSISTLFQAPTVETLAGVLRSRERAAGSPLVLIQPGEGGTPFFCVHPVGGNVLCYRDLARELGPELPFYGLQVTRRDGEPPRSQALEEMASSYIVALREVQPQGPYHLGGWSMGGVVAFEMAQQFLRLGEEVKVLALIDAVTPGGLGQSADVDEAVLASWFARDFGGLLGIRLEIRPDDFRDLTPERQAELVLERVRGCDAIPAGLDTSAVRHHLEIFTRNFTTLLGYTPRAYQGRLVLFNAGDAEEGQGKLDSVEVWRGLARGGTEVHVVPGDHYTMVCQPRVRSLGEQLRLYLQGGTP